MTFSAISEARKQTLQTRMGCGLTWSWSDRSWSEPSRVWSVQCILGVSCVLLSGWIVLFFWCIASRLARHTLVELLLPLVTLQVTSLDIWCQVPCTCPHAWQLSRLPHSCHCIGIWEEGSATNDSPRPICRCWGRPLGLRFGHVDAACALDRIGIRWLRQESGPAGNIVWASSPLKTFF